LSFFSFWKKLNQSHNNTDQSLWEKLDAFQTKPKRKKHRFKISNKQETDMDIWNKLDAYYEKQEAKLQKLSRRDRLSDIPT